MKNWKEIRCLQKLRGIVSRQRGSILLLTAFALPALVGAVGLSVDVGNVYLHKARLQSATDAAALAGGHAYAENENGGDAKKAATSLMNTNEGKGAYALDDVTCRDADDGSTRITVEASQQLPLVFLGHFVHTDDGGPGKWTVRTQSTAAVTWTESEVARMFSYAMIGGYAGKATPGQMDSFWGNTQGNGKNAITVHTSPITVHGKVHTNGPVWVDMANVSNGTYYAYADEFSCNATKDADLWSNVHDNYDDHYVQRDGAYGLDKPDGIRPSHVNDDKIAGGSGPNHDMNWRFYSRFAPKDQQDYTAAATNTGFIDISFSKSNPMTNTLYNQVERWRRMRADGDLKRLEDEHTYIDTNGNYAESSGAYTNYQLNPSHDKSIYPGVTSGQFQVTDSESWRVWDKVYKNIITDGDITLNAPSGVQHKEGEHLLFVSLHGNISIQNSAPFYGFLYAPNGTVLIDGAQPIYGSIVAKHIIITTPNQAITATNDTFSSGGTNGKRHKSANVALVDA